LPAAYQPQGVQAHRQAGIRFGAIALVQRRRGILCGPLDVQRSSAPHHVPPGGVVCQQAAARYGDYRIVLARIGISALAANNEKRSAASSRQAAGGVTLTHRDAAARSAATGATDHAGAGTVAGATAVVAPPQRSSSLSYASQRPCRFAGSPLVCKNC
jgi:hypothetical protein